MTEGDDTGSNEQKAVAKGAGSLAINAAQYANVTVYQYVTYAGDKVSVRETNDPSRCPYPGLETFRTSEAEFFAGREDDVAEMQTKLRENDICGVISASGAGKSSLVHAGLIPALAKRETEAWDVFAFKPGNNPLYELAKTLSGVLASDKEIDDQRKQAKSHAESLRTESGVLAEYLQLIKQRREASVRDKHHHVLIFIDQWEELYTRENDKDRDILVRELMDVAERGLAKVLLTMRIDFMGEMLQLSPDLFRTLKPGLHYVESMDEIGLRSAIQLPAAEVGLEVPEDLTSRFIADLGKGRDHGSLPYLQFVLRQLWEKRDRETNSLTTEAYNEMKGLTGAIGAHADDVFRKLSKEEQDMAQRVLPRLANVSEIGAITSRRLPFADFDKPARELLRKLAAPDRRLIVLSSATEEVVEAEIVAEVAHEALLDDWKTLSGWIADRKDFFRLRNKLEADAKTWIENERSKDFLTLKGRTLLEARKLSLHTELGEVSKNLCEFIRANLKRKTLINSMYGVAFAAFISASFGVLYLFILSTQAKQLEAVSRLSAEIEKARNLIESGQVTEAILAVQNAWPNADRASLLESNSSFPRVLADSIRFQSEFFRLPGNWLALHADPKVGKVFAVDNDFQINIFNSDTGDLSKKIDIHSLSSKIKRDLPIWVDLESSQGSQFLAITVNVSESVVNAEGSVGDKYGAPQKHFFFLYNLESGEYWTWNQRTENPYGTVFNVDFSPNGQYFSLYGDWGVSVYSLPDENGDSSLEEISTLNSWALDGSVRRTFFHPNGRSLAVELRTSDFLPEMAFFDFLSQKFEVEILQLPENWSKISISHDFENVYGLVDSDSFNELELQYIPFLDLWNRSRGIGDSLFSGFLNSPHETTSIFRTDPRLRSVDMYGEYFLVETYDIAADSSKTAAYLLSDPSNVLLSLDRERAQIRFSENGILFASEYVEDNVTHTSAHRLTRNRSVRADVGDPRVLVDWRKNGTILWSGSRHAGVIQPTGEYSKFKLDPPPYPDNGYDNAHHALEGGLLWYNLDVGTVVWDLVSQSKIVNEFEGELVDALLRNDTLLGLEVTENGNSLKMNRYSEGEAIEGRNLLTLDEDSSGSLIFVESVGKAVLFETSDKTITHVIDADGKVTSKRDENSLPNTWGIDNFSGSWQAVLPGSILDLSTGATVWEAPVGTENVSVDPSGTKVAYALDGKVYIELLPFSPSQLLEAACDALPSQPKVDDYDPIKAPQALRNSKCHQNPASSANAEKISSFWSSLQTVDR